ncbi:hypothetical protein GCM10010440_00430 [Kitasatospora cinereorecta]
MVTAEGVAVGDDPRRRRDPVAAEAVAKTQFHGAPEQECAAEEYENGSARQCRRRLHPAPPRTVHSLWTAASQPTDNPGLTFDVRPATRRGPMGELPPPAKGHARARPACHNAWTGAVRPDLSQRGPLCHSTGPPCHSRATAATGRHPQAVCTDTGPQPTTATPGGLQP